MYIYLSKEKIGFKEDCETRMALTPLAIIYICN